MVLSLTNLQRFIYPGVDGGSLVTGHEVYRNSFYKSNYTWATRKLIATSNKHINPLTLQIGHEGYRVQKKYSERSRPNSALPFG